MRGCMHVWMRMCACVRVCERKRQRERERERVARMHLITNNSMTNDHLLGNFDHVKWLYN